MKHGPSLFTCAAVLAGCDGSTTVVVRDSDPIPTYRESEPNDDAWNADWMGSLASGDALCIVGDVRDDGHDPQDGFALQASQPIDVEFELVPACGCADLDLWIYDPTLDEFVAAFDSPYSAEKGAFTVWNPGFEFHLVVVSAAGDASYELRLSTSAAQGILAATAGESPSLVPSAAGRRPDSAPPAALARYLREARPAVGGPLQRIEVLRIDEDTGSVERMSFVPGPDGLVAVEIGSLFED